MNILYNEKNKKIIMYVSYLKKITDYYSENEDFQNLGVEIEGLKSNLNYNWSLNDSQKELLKALENRENNSIHKSTLDKINSNDTKMNIVKELVGLKLFSEILYSERVEYLIKEEEILSKNKPLISIPVEANQYYKKENQETAKILLKAMRETYPQLYIPEDVESLFKNVDNEVETLKEGLRNLSSNEEYKKLFEIFEGRFQDYSYADNGREVIKDREKMILNAPIFNALKENAINIPHKVSDLLESHDHDEYSDNKYYFLKFDIDIKEITGLIFKAGLEKKIELPIKEYLDNIDSLKFKNEKKYTTSDGRNRLDISQDWIEQETKSRFREMELIERERADIEKELLERERLAELKEKEKERQNSTGVEDIKELLNNLKERNFFNSTVNEKDGYILVEKEYNKENYPIWLEIKNMSDDKMYCEVSSLGNDLKIENKVNGELREIKDIFEEMYPFGININKSEVLIASQNPININNLIEINMNNKEVYSMNTSKESQKDNQKINKKKPT
tara:strand:- start:6563 stop:8086 length:1524 start_codon:yes stop_codon:yes gene_type:complete